MNRKIRIGTIACLVLSSMLVTQVSSAQEGTRGGGDTSTLASFRPPLLKVELEQYIRASLKDALIKYVKNADATSNWVMPRFKLAMQRMTRAALIEDIQKSPYELEEICRDERGSRKGLSTINGAKASKICFDSTLLANEGTSLDQLVGLAFHDHARHFEVDDEDHKIANYVVSDCQDNIAPNLRRTQRAECTATSPGKNGQKVRPEDYFLGMWISPPGEPQIKQGINSQYSFSVKRVGWGFESTISLQLWKKAWGRTTLVAEAKAPMGERMRGFPYQISAYSGSDDIEVECVCDFLPPTSPEVLEQLNRAVRRR